MKILRSNYVNSPNKFLISFLSSSHNFYEDFILPVKIHFNVVFLL